MSKKLVTSAQVESLRTMAIAKGVSREEFQVWLDKYAGLTLDRIKIEAIEAIAPPGAQLHTFRIRYQSNRNWQEAVNAGASDTSRENDIMKVGGLYPATGTTRIVEEYIVLLNYPSNDGSWVKAMVWARWAKLRNTVPREVFALGELYPKLQHNIQTHDSPVYVVATTGCSFEGRRHACSVWWSDPIRDAQLMAFPICRDKNCWYAFRM